MMNKVQLGVFFGSRSCEHEVSIISALQVMNAADKEKYDVVPVYISTKGQWYTGEGLRDIKSFTPFKEDAKDIIPVSLDMTPGSGALLAYEQKKGLFGGLQQRVAGRVDCAVLVMHGMHGEDGTLQGMLELANLPYTSSGVAGCAIGMDKIVMKQFFRGEDLPLVPGQWYSRDAWEKDADAVLAEAEKIGYPIFVKPANLGSSIGVSRATYREELAEAFAVAFSFDRRVLAEKGLTHMIELNCAVLGYGDEVEASVLEMPKSDGFLDFMTKYMQGNKLGEGMASLARIVPAPIDDSLRDKIQNMSKDIFHLLDCKGVIRIDYMFDIDSESLYINEINTIPGSMAYYLWEASGLSFTKLIDKMVGYAWKAHEEKNANNFAFESDILKGVVLGTKSGAKG